MPSAHSRSRSGVARGALACRSTARGNNGLGLGDAGSTSSVKPSIQMPSQSPPSASSRPSTSRRARGSRCG
ncbi:hypothetical protein G6F24_018800 [Rhizopus arrhizus]|nr:hypothetical protein G6F24_018800 [Rhizopus arrhizus]